MSTLRSLVFGNWPLKLAALALATVLYAGVAVSESTRSWDEPVPIEVLRAPAGGALLELPGVVDEIRFRAPRDVARQLAADSFRASVDLSSVQPRPGAEPVPVPVDVFPLDPRVRVVDHSPRSVNVRLDEVVTRSLPVTIDPGVIPDGIELGPIIAEPGQVSVTGASSRVQNVRSVEGRIPVDSSGINIDRDVLMEAFDEQGAPVSGVEIQPASVRVTADAARRLGYATLPVVPDIVGEPARGKRITSVSVAPATVTVGGEDTVVRQMASIPTDSIDVSGLDADLEAQVSLILPDEITTTTEPVVSLVVEVADEAGSRRLELGTALSGARADRTYDVSDSAVSVVVAGPLALLDDLAVSELVVELPVAGLDVGDHAVVPRLQLPAGLSAAGFLPELVDVSVGVTS